MIHDYAIGELESLIVKAYRGCGFSWGLAQEAGAAAVTLALSGLPSALPFAALLQSIDGHSYAQLAPNDRSVDRWAGTGGALCPVISGSVLSDFGISSIREGETLLIKDVLLPIIVLPFACRLGQSVEVSIHDTVYMCSSEGITWTGGSPINNSNPATIMLRRHSQCGEYGERQQRARIDDASLAVLQNFAHRTYVPASEASRLAGAGAGLHDND